MSPLRIFSSRLVTTSPAVRLISTKGVEGTASVPDKEVKTEAQKNASLDFMNPFESVPLGELATYLGERFSPKLEEIKAHETAKNRPKHYAEVTEPPEIPHLLPLTRWAANSKEVRETLIVDEAKRMKPRLSWYHPDDTMVPRGWFGKGLIEDLKYYKPFWKE